MHANRMNVRFAPEDHVGFAVPESPTHSLMLLNSSMRTDLLLNIHRHVRRSMDQRKPGSPLHYLAEGLAHVIGSYDGVNLFECVARNQLHVDPDREFQPEQDYQHDIRLMKHHLQCNRKTIRELGRYL